MSMTPEMQKQKEEWIERNRGKGLPDFKGGPKPKRKIPKSRLGGKLKQRLRKLLKNRRKTARKGKRAGRRQRRTGVGEGIGGHMAIIDGKNWDGSRNNPRANARRERQRQRAARKPVKLTRDQRRRHRGDVKRGLRGITPAQNRRRLASPKNNPPVDRGDGVRRLNKKNLR
jgi:hypothetical protein